MLQMEGSVYWPVEKGVEMVVGRVKLTLQSSNTCKHWVERIIYITDSRMSRVVVHLQFTEWPGRLVKLSQTNPFQPALPLITFLLVDDQQCWIVNKYLQYGTSSKYSSLFYFGKGLKR